MAEIHRFHRSPVEVGSWSTIIYRVLWPSQVVIAHGISPGRAAVDLVECFSLQHDLSTMISARPHRESHALKCQTSTEKRPKKTGRFCFANHKSGGLSGTTKMCLYKNEFKIQKRSKTANFSKFASSFYFNTSIENKTCLPLIIFAMHLFRWPVGNSYHGTSWWLNQPSWKICSSKWVHLPQFSGWTFQKYLSCHQLGVDFNYQPQLVSWSRISAPLTVHLVTSGSSFQKKIHQQNVPPGDVLSSCQATKWSTSFRNCDSHPWQEAKLRSSCVDSSWGWWLGW